MTPFTDIYRLFLAKVNSYDLTTYTLEELEEDLLGYLELSIANFTVCTKDLSEVENHSFKAKLNTKEKNILANFMVLEFLRPKMTTDELIVQAMTDKDIRMTSQANHLKLVMEHYKNLERRVNNEMNSYIVKQGLDGMKNASTK